MWKYLLCILCHLLALFFRERLPQNGECVYGMDWYINNSYRWYESHHLLWVPSNALAYNPLSTAKHVNLDLGGSKLLTETGHALRSGVVLRGMTGRGRNCQGGVTIQGSISVDVRP